jgi:hypothetical protein
MGKLEVVRHIQWLVFKINLVKKYFNQMKLMALSQEQLKIYGKLY